MKYKNMSISIIIPVMAIKSGECVNLKPEIQKYSKTIKNDETWWLEHGRNKFFSYTNQEDKVACYELLETDRDFNLRRKLGIYQNKNNNFDTYSFCNKDLTGIKFEISDFRLWQRGKYVFIEVNLITNSTEGNELNAEKIQKFIEIFTRKIQRRKETLFFYTEKVEDGNIVERKTSLKEILESFKNIFIDNSQNVVFKYVDLFILSYFVTKQEEIINEQNILKEISKIYNKENESQRYRYIGYNNLQHWVVNKDSLSLFVREKNNYAKIKTGNLYNNVFHMYMLLLIYYRTIQFKVKENGVSDNIKKWSEYTKFCNFSRNEHVNLMFKNYLFMAFELDTIKGAKIPLDNDIEEKPYIFISYSNKDYKEVYPILAELKENGIPFWYDEGLDYGNSWEEQVKKKMSSDNCKGVLFFSSANSFSSDSIIKEIKIAYEEKKRTDGKKGYCIVSISDAKNTTAILKETMCSIDKENLGKKWGTEQIKCIVNAFPDNDILISIKSKSDIKNKVINYLKE